jgi:DNA-directed RNA polymerase specialized sigma24 family protein
MEIKDITYRHIAIMFSKALPIDGDEFRASVEHNLKTIKSLPAPAKVALRSAYIFSRKVPRQEREDLFQEIALAVLKTKTPDERLAYAIARCDWRDWWKKYKIRQHYSLDSVTEDEEGNPVTLGELIVGESEFEIKMNGDLDAMRIWNRLPDKIKAIVKKRLLSQPLLNTERAALSYFVKTQGTQLLLATS